MTPEQKLDKAAQECGWTSWAYTKDDNISETHTLTPPAKRVKTWHYLINGYVTHCSYPIEPNIGYTITEQQPDGSWKIIETTLKASE